MSVCESHSTNVGAQEIRLYFSLSELNFSTEYPAPPCRVELPAITAVFRSKPAAPSRLTALCLCSFFWSGVWAELHLPKVLFLCCLSLQWIWTGGGCQGTNKLLASADPEISNLIMFTSMHLLQLLKAKALELQKFKTDSHLGYFMPCHPSLRQRMQNGLMDWMRKETNRYKECRRR